MVFIGGVIHAPRLGPDVVLAMVLTEFWRGAAAILDGLLTRLQRPPPVLGELLGRARLLVAHDLAVELPRPDAFALDAHLLVARPRSALQVLPLARHLGHGFSPPSLQDTR